MDFFGNWPSQVPNIFRRPECEEFANSLKHLCNQKRGSIVLHGPAGSGKTTLAVFTIRRDLYEILAGAGNVRFAFWLNVSQMTGNDEYFDEDDFYASIYELLHNADLVPNDCKPKAEAIRKSLAERMGNQKMLFVFDDVFNSGVLRCVSKLGDNILALGITRNPLKAKYETPNFKCSTFPMGSMTKESMIEMLSTFFHLTSKGLDPEKQIDKLAGICLGLPLIASIIDSQFKKMLDPSKIQNRYWALVRNFKEVNAANYPTDKFPDNDEAQLNVSKLLTFTPEFGSSFIRELLYMFLIFPSGQQVSKVDLKIIWQHGAFEDVEQRCQSAVDASFLQLTENGDYVLHDLLYLAVMKEAQNELKCPRPSDVRRKLLEQCTGDVNKVLEAAIQNNRPGLLKIFLECSADQLLTDLQMSPLQSMVIKTLSPNESAIESSFFCRFAEIWLSQSTRNEFPEETLAAVAQTMSRQKMAVNIFLMAVKLNCLKLVASLLKCGFEIIVECVTDCLDETGNNALIIACIYGHANMVQILLSLSHFDLNFRNHRGETAIWHCVIADSALEIVKLFWTLRGETNVDVNLADSIFGHIPLHNGVVYNKLDLVRYMVDVMGADVTIKNKLNGANSAELALAVYERFEIGEFLISKPGGDVSMQWLEKAVSNATRANKKSIAMRLMINSLQHHLPVAHSTGSATEIHQAVEAESLEKLRKISTENPRFWAENVNNSDEDGKSALFKAALHGHVDIICLLLQNGALKVLNEGGSDGWTPLMIACQNGHVEACLLLVEHGASVDLRSIEGGTALTTVCQGGHLKIAKLLIEHGADVDAVNNAGNTALGLASLAGHLSTVELLLDSGARVDGSKTEGGSWTPLMAACQSGNFEVAKLLIERGACVELHGPDSRTALMLSSGNGHDKIVKLLIDSGANVDAKRLDGLTALAFAVQQGQLEVARMLLDNGADSNLSTVDNVSPLTTAAQYGYDDIIDLLLEHGASIDHQTDVGATALMMASQNGHLETSRKLIDAKAKLDIRKKDGATALVVALQYGHSEIFKMLVEQHADIDMQNNDGWAPIISACSSGNTPAVRLLLDHDAKIDSQSNNGYCALLAASENGFEPIVALLLERGANVDIQNSDGATALMLASQNGHMGTVKTLLDFDANVNLQSSDGRTALMPASQNGHVEVIRLLLLHGANADLQRNDGMTALMPACQNGNEEIIRLLIAHMTNVDSQMNETKMSALMIACHFGNSSIVKMLLDKGADIELKDSDGDRALEYAKQGGHTEIVNFLTR